MCYSYRPVCCEWVSTCLNVQVTAIQRLASVFSPSEDIYTSNDTVEGLTDFFCGEGFSINGFGSFVGNIRSRQDNLDSKLHSKRTSRSVSPENQFRPKIFYAPKSNSIVRDIIAKANKTFSAITDLNNAMDKAVECSNEVILRIPPNSPQANRLNSVSVEILATTSFCICTIMWVYLCIYTPSICHVLVVLCVYICETFLSWSLCKAATSQKQPASLAPNSTKALHSTSVGQPPLHKGQIDPVAMVTCV